MVFTTRVLTAGARRRRGDLLERLAAVPAALRRHRRLAADRDHAADEPAAADGDTDKLVADLSLGGRLSTVMLVPLSAVLTVAGSAIGIALFTYGGPTRRRRAARRRAGLLGVRHPAVRAGHAAAAGVLRDEGRRTPTLIMIVMTAVKIPLLYLCRDRCSPSDVVIGVLLVNALTFVVGAVLGQMWLWVRLGRLQSMRVVGVIVQSVVAGAVGVAARVRRRPADRPRAADGAGATLTAWVLLVVAGHRRRSWSRSACSPRSRCRSSTRRCNESPDWCVEGRANEREERRRSRRLVPIGRTHGRPSRDLALALGGERAVTTRRTDSLDGRVEPRRRRRGELPAARRRHRRRPIPPARPVRRRRAGGRAPVARPRRPAAPRRGADRAGRRAGRRGRAPRTPGARWSAPCTPPGSTTPGWPGCWTC